MYETGDLIIYGNEGVCKVDAIGMPDIPVLGKKDYTIHFCRSIRRGENLHTC